MNLALVVELAFEATPERLAARPVHRQRLERLHAEGVLFAAGPFADDSGAMWTFFMLCGRLEASLVFRRHFLPAKGTEGISAVSTPR